MIAAVEGKAKRINVIMPFLYEGRQHKRSGRESLDCAYALTELAEMGVTNFITFDAHDPRVQNATPLCGFDNFTPPYQFMRALLDNVPDLIIDKDHMMVISPDEGALDRTTYFANVLGVNIGMFYKRRDYSVIVNGKNPIVAHEFLGDNIDGKDIVIVDDMISSGGSMLDTARQLKEMNARRVFICTTFGLFTDGMAAFDEAYEKGWFDKVITTNLTYQIPELLSRPYYIEADMSKFLASIIDFMNHDVSMSNVLTPTEKIRTILEKYNKRESCYKFRYQTAILSGVFIVKRANHCKVQNGSLFLFMTIECAQNVHSIVCCQLRSKISQSLLHHHLCICRKLKRQFSGLLLIPECHRGIIIVSRSCPAKVVHCHLKILRKINRIFYMEAVKQKALLLVVKLFVIAKDRI